MTRSPHSNSILSDAVVKHLDSALTQIAHVSSWVVLFCSVSSFALSAHADAKFPPGFAFGVANAPAQVEDGLSDVWLDWAKAGHMHAWANTAQPNERLQFWSHPETELNLAHNLGVNAFRMGLDWGRLMPTRNTIDQGAVLRYRQTILLAKSKGMKVMLTLWHHDVPKWVQESNGWHNPENAKSFEIFARQMITEFHDDVEWFVTFNEVNVFVLNAYITGTWPPGEHHSAISILPIFNGSSVQVLDLFASTHNSIYEWAHKTYPAVKLGLAHNMAHYRGSGLFDRIAAGQADKAMNWHLPKMVEGHLDFFGINYYGAEFLKGNSVDIDNGEEVSDAGRAIDVNGLYDLLKKVSSRYPKLPVLMTENGIADSSDKLRPAYLIEHLLAIHKAMSEGVKVAGYFVWTLTDNLEWTDGYCPRFGLVGVKRETMDRVPRESFNLYSEIIRTSTITDLQRVQAWNEVVANQGKPRFMCRATDGSTALDSPRTSKFVTKDWRFKNQ